MVPEFALVPVDEVLLAWADEIVCMDRRQAAEIKNMLGDEERPIVVLDIPDNFRYRDPKLIELIREAYNDHLKKLSE
jgi:predicted protein tyrosine phosphatase